MTQPPASQSSPDRLGRNNRHKTGICIATGREFPLHDLFPVSLLKPILADKLRAQIGDYPPDAMISRGEMDRLRTAHIADLLKEERGELSGLETDVLESLSRHQILADNIESELDVRRTLGERLSDNLAYFGGSWTFLIMFGVVLALWILWNAAQSGAGFDPFPFILLNLLLSCIAAVQAPIIMMSQRRQEAKDRERSLNDYRINLKAELEIRHLHEKIDHILTRQWERLAEMQEVQIELLQEIQGRAPKAK